MAWATMTNLSTGDLVTETHMDNIRGNIEYLLDPNKDQAIRDNTTNYTTTSTSFVDVDATNLSFTITTNGGPVEVWFSVPYMANGGGRPSFDVDVNGTRIGASFSHGLATGGASPTTGDVHTVSWKGYHEIAAGNHTFKLQYRVFSSGTVTIPSAGNHATTFGVMER